MSYGDVQADRGGFRAGTAESGGGLQELSRRLLVGSLCSGSAGGAVVSGYSLGASAVCAGSAAGVIYLGLQYLYCRGRLHSLQTRRPLTTAAPPVGRGGLTMSRVPVPRSTREWLALTAVVVIGVGLLAAYGLRIAAQPRDPDFQPRKVLDPLPPITRFPVKPVREAGDA